MTPRASTPRARSSRMSASQERRLAGARARHDVHEERALLGALGAEGVGCLVVGRQDVLLHFDDARLIHDASFAGAEPCRPAPSKYCLAP